MTHHCAHCDFEIPGTVGSPPEACPHCGESLDFSAAATVDEQPKTDRPSGEIKVGQQIGRFEVKSFLGRGGFGSVYRAFDPYLERFVAIKLPRTAELSDKQIASVVSEARITAQLRHPNIVAVHEVLGDDKTVYIVSDVIEGEPLSHWMKHNRPSQTEVIKLMIILARALHHAHCAGVVHRDFKPGNVILDKDMQPCITDFGLALRNRSDDNDASEAKRPSERGRVVVGTPAYMSPEQAAGLGAEATPASDIYSLAVVFYELLSGQRPFQGTYSEVVNQTLFSEPPPLSRVAPGTPRELAAICHKGLAKEPSRRFQSAAEMADELERFQSGRPTLTTPLGIHLRAARFLKRHQWSLALAVGLAVLIIAGLWAWQRTNEWMLTRCRVRIVTDPPGCQIAIVPLDDLTGVPLVDQCLRPPIANDYPLTIKPGWYLIEAYHPELGVQEVFRFVSRELADYQAVKNEPNLKHIPSCRSAAEIEANGRVMLPPIRLLSGKEQAKPNTMSLVDGGEFRTGSDVVTIFPQELVNVPAFWMDTQEVSIGEYEAVMGSLPLQLRLDPEAARADRDSPVRQVQYFEALEYAERTGKRLPTLDEYLFATTNGGTTKFPWGDDLIEHDWDITASQPPSFDFNRGMPPVGGLFSRVVEWTQSSPTQPLPTFAQAVGGLPSNSSPPIGGAMRVLVGGGPSVSIGKPSAIEAEMGPRFLNLFSTYEAPALGIGFRCVRSVKPRFVLLK